MAYTIELSQVAQDQVQALPASALIPFAEALTVLELLPWSGRPYNANNPEDAVRVVSFASDGLITYLVLDDQQIVDILDVQWIELAVDD